MRRRSPGRRHRNTDSPSSPSTTTYAEVKTKPSSPPVRACSEQSTSSSGNAPLDWPPVLVAAASGSGEGEQPCGQHCAESSEGCIERSWQAAVPTGLVTASRPRVQPMQTDTQLVYAEGRTDAGSPRPATSHDPRPAGPRRLRRPTAATSRHGRWCANGRWTPGPARCASGEATSSLPTRRSSPACAWSTSNSNVCSSATAWDVGSGTS